MLKQVFLAGMALVPGNIWRWMERGSTIAVLLGVPFFFVDRYLQVQRDKESTTLEFVKRYQDPQLVSQRFALLAPWVHYDLATLHAANPSRKAIEDLVIKMIEISTEGGERSDLRTAIFDVVDFFEVLKLCIDVGRCNEELAIAYFQQYSRQFYCLYYPYIRKLRAQQSMPQYGKRAEQFALAKEACP